MNTNITIKEKSYEIKKGPSKDALIDAFKYAYSKTDERPPIPLDFKIAIGYTGLPSDPKTAYIAAKIKNLRVTSIEHEDGSGESFNIAGYCDADLGVNQTRYQHYRFTAYYNTKNRTGRMCFALRTP